MIRFSLLFAFLLMFASCLLPFEDCSEHEFGEAQCTAITTNEIPVTTVTQVHAIGTYEGYSTKSSSGSNWYPGCTCGSKDQPGQITVTVEPSTQPRLLVLTAYDAVTWNIVMSPDKGGEGVGNDIKTPKQNLVGVILAGYYYQDVKGLSSDVPVVRRTYYGSFYPKDDEVDSEDYFCAYEVDGEVYYEGVENMDCCADHEDTEYYSLLNAKINCLTGLDITTWQGAYSASSFTVN